MTQNLTLSVVAISAEHINTYKAKVYNTITNRVTVTSGLKI